MRPQDDDGTELNAEFAVVGDGAYTSVVLESAGGRSGHSGRSRNDQYVPALRLLLQRLGRRQAVLQAAVVASARLAALPESERTLLAGPIDLTGVTDIERLRLDITRAQGRIGLPAGAAKEGNNRKRILLRLSVPGYGPGDAAQLAADLARPISDVPRKGWDAREVLRPLIGVEIRTVSGRANTVLGVTRGTVLVRTERSPAGQPVDLGDVQRGLDLMAARGRVRVNVDELGHRSAFVGAVLATLPAAHVTTNPAMVTLDKQTSDEIAADPDFANLDGEAQVKIRKEQAQLRKLLVGDREVAPCALCGQDFPVEFLVAAHVKRRAVCTDDERRDLKSVAMLACSFGCDALYEAGWITVDAAGRIKAAPLDGLPAAFRDRIQHLDGFSCSAHHSLSEKYFAWHRAKVFRAGESSAGSLPRADLEAPAV